VVRQTSPVVEEEVAVVVVLADLVAQVGLEEVDLAAGLVEVVEPSRLMRPEMPTLLLTSRR